MTEEDKIEIKADKEIKSIIDEILNNDNKISIQKEIILNDLKDKEGWYHNLKLTFKLEEMINKKNER